MRIQGFFEYAFTDIAFAMQFPISMRAQERRMAASAPSLVNGDWTLANASIVVLGHLLVGKFFLRCHQRWSQSDKLRVMPTHNMASRLANRSL